MANIGERIKETRKEKKLSQADYAKSIGVTQGFLSNIEKGRHQPTTDLIIRITNNYQVDANWLLTGINRKNEDNTKNEIIQIVEGLPEEKQKEVLKYAEERKLLAEITNQ